MFAMYKIGPVIFMHDSTITILMSYGDEYLVPLDGDKHAPLSYYGNGDCDFRLIGDMRVL